MSRGAEFQTFCQFALAVRSAGDYSCLGWLWMTGFSQGRAVPIAV
jgi:hypothetical protein